MPSPEHWQAAIAEREFPLKIDTEFDVAALSGWLPCEYQGKPGGFEYLYSLLARTSCANPKYPNRFPVRSCSPRIQRRRIPTRRRRGGGLS